MELHNFSLVLLTVVVILLSLTSIIGTAIGPIATITPLVLAIVLVALHIKSNSNKE